MDARTRNLVRRRAGGYCEYCRLPETAIPLATLQIEHVVARQHLGGDEPDNLAMACPWCNRAKGPNLSGRDSQTGAIVPLFNPRTQEWDEHFYHDGALVVGITAIGRATVQVLAMNRFDLVKLRRSLLHEEDETL
jgi:hypothetical protein